MNVSASGRCADPAARRARLALDQTVGERPQDVGDLPRIARREGCPRRRPAAPPRRGSAGSSARAASPPRSRPRAARRSPAGSRAPRRSGSSRGCASSARSRSARSGGSRSGGGQIRAASTASRSLRSKCSPLLREHGDVELGLVLEVAVERSLGDSGALRDLVEVRLHEAVAEEDLARRLEDAAARLRLPRLAPLARVERRTVREARVARSIARGRRHCPRSGTDRTAWSGCSARRSSG